jgi:hypothetical protein
MRQAGARHRCYGEQGGLWRLDMVTSRKRSQAKLACVYLVHGSNRRRVAVWRAATLRQGAEKTRAAFMTAPTVVGGGVDTVHSVNSHKASPPEYI